MGRLGAVKRHVTMGNLGNLFNGASDMARKAIDPEQQERYLMVKEHVKLWGMEISRKLDQRVRFRLQKANHRLGLYNYIESVDGRDHCRVILKIHRGQVVIHESYMLPRALKRALKGLSLSFMERLKMTKAENTWKGCKS
jgi:hypothetical protein